MLRFFPWWLAYKQIKPTRKEHERLKQHCQAEVANPGGGEDLVTPPQDV